MLAEEHRRHGDHGCRSHAGNLKTDRPEQELGIGGIFCGCQGIDFRSVLFFFFFSCIYWKRAFWYIPNSDFCGATLPFVFVLRKTAHSRKKYVWYVFNGFELKWTELSLPRGSINKSGIFEPSRILAGTLNPWNDRVPKTSRQPSLFPSLWK